MSKIGIIGGAFDPIHWGHLRLGEAMLKYVDEVWFQPCHTHMHGKDMSSDEDRLKMCQLAVENEFPIIVKRKKMKVSDFEIVHQLQLCTYDVLKEQTFTELSYKSPAFQLIIGQDNGDTIETWQKHEELRRDFAIIVVNRDGQPRSEGKWYQQEPHLYLPNEIIPSVWSRKIRTRLKSSERSILLLETPEEQLEYAYHKNEHEKFVKECLPLSVLQYIDEHNLYA